MANVDWPDGRSGTAEIWHSLKLAPRLLRWGAAVTEEAAASSETKLVKASIV